jgi:outer membrane receptor protein involved in Fe transport
MSARYPFALAMLAVLIAVNVEAANLSEEKLTQLFEMSFEELLTVKVETTSKRLETRSEAPGAISVITRDEIRLFGARNLHQLMQYLPGIWTTGSHLRPDSLATIRGDVQSHAENHVLTLLNGRPIRESLSGGAHQSLYLGFPVEAIDRIELIRGPGSVLYGRNAYSGVINIITSVEETPSLTAIAEAGSFEYVSGTLAGGDSVGPLHFGATLQAINEGGWRYSIVDQIEEQDSMDMAQKSIAATLRAELDGWSLDFFATRQERAAIGAQPIWAAIPGNETKENSVFVNLGYRQPLADSWSVVANVGFNYHDIETHEGDLFALSRDWLFELTVSGEPFDGFNVVAGGVVEYLSGPASRQNRRPSYDETPFRFYLQADHQVTRWAKLVGGLQLNKREGQEVNLSPRGGVILNFGDRWGAKLLYGRAFRSPAAGETKPPGPGLGVDGNPDLNPETVQTFDAQLLYHAPNVAITAGAFYSQLDDLIIRVPTPDPNDGNRQGFANGGEMEFWGLELEGKYFMNDSLYLLSSLTYQSSKEDEGTPYSVVPHVMFKLGAGYTWRTFKLGVFYNFYSDPKSISTALQVNPDPEAGHLLSAKLEWDASSWLNAPRDRIVLQLRGENLADQAIHHPEFTGRKINSLPRLPGVAVYGAVRCQF